MDRYEYNVRLEQIRSLSENQEFHEAMVIADTIDWRKVRSVRTLSFISEIYKINRRYEEARDLLLIADSRCPNARSIIYALCELSIRMGDLNDSVGYLKEYMELAPQDPSTYVLQYKFYELTDVGIQQRIEILEELKNVDYQERWGYELAKLYAKAGDITKCIEACDRLVIWFGHGKYVTKALELKMQYAPLTPEQQHKYDHKDALEVLAGAEDLTGGSVKEDDVDRGPIPIEISNIQPSNQPTNRIPDKEIKNKLGVEDIKEPSVNLDKYSTMNLQAELRRNMTELETRTGELLREREVPLPPMRDITPIKADTDVSELTADSEIPMAPIASAPEKPAASAKIPVPEVPVAPVQTPVPGPAVAPVQAPVPKVTVAPVQVPVPEVSAAPEPKVSVVPTIRKPAPRIDSGDDDILSNRIPLNIGSRRESDVEREFARILSEDYDGQLSLNVPDGPGVAERQITGQINIDDILNGWNINKKKNSTETGITPTPEPAMAVMPETPVPKAPVPETAVPKAPVPERAESTRIQVEAPENAFSAPEPEEEGSYSRGSMKRETLAVTSDLTGLLREHREKVNARLKKEREEKEELREETEPGVPETEAEEPYYEEPAAKEPDYEEPYYEEPDYEEPEEEEPEDEKPYVAPKAPEIHGFDEEEKEIFAQFLPMHDLPDIIRDALNRMKLNGKSGNVFITGNEQSARLSLASALAKGFMYEHSDEFVGKVAKIPADIFNTKDVQDVLRTLDGCALVIEHAADLTDASLEDIRTILTKPETSIILILEETKASFRMLERNHKKDWFDDVFDVKIEIPTYTNDDLVFHGREYAREQEYIIDDMGVLALYTRIDERQTADHFVTIDEVEEIVDAAIRHVNRKTPGHFLDVVVGKRYDDDDMIILREKDFV